MPQPSLTRLGLFVLAETKTPALLAQAKASRSSFRRKLWRGLRREIRRFGERVGARGFRAETVRRIEEPEPRLWPGPSDSSRSVPPQCEKVMRFSLRDDFSNIKSALNVDCLSF